MFFGPQKFSKCSIAKRAARASGGSPIFIAGFRPASVTQTGFQEF